ncbi:MAG: TonB-dependent receptor [Acidobacteria bacterium]|nr:TonB-dependent receptor [Acidobacteriota bacterium]
MQPRLRLYGQALTLILALAGPGFLSATAAQGGRVRGIVRDPDRRPIPQATVTLEGPLAGQASSTSSDADGAFEVAAPVAGRYVVRGRIEGLEATTVVEVTAGEVARADLDLRLTAVGESLVVTAAQVDLPLSRVPDSTTVIDARTLDLRQQFTLGQALQSVPGVIVQQNGGTGAVTSLFTRGGESDYTLVLIDGVRANAFGGGIDLSQVPLADVERVEVVRGPQSALYGADAIGGVVHILTRAGAAPSVQGLFEAGSRGMRRGAASTTGERRGLRWQAGGDWFAEDGFTGLAANGERVSNDDARTSQAAVTLGWRRPGGTDVQGTLRYVDAARGTPGPYGSDPAGRFFGVDRAARTLTRRASGGLRWLQPWFGAGSLVRQRTEFDASDHDLTFESAFPSEGESRRTHVRTQTDVAASAALGFTGGVEWLGERGGSTYITAGAAGAVPVRRSVLGFFGEARWQASSRLSVTAGLRGERIRRLAFPGDPMAFTPRPDFQAETIASVNPKVAVSWMVVGDPASSRGWTRIHAAAGTGIRPPDAFEIAFTDNAGLKPERSTSADFGVAQVLAGGAVQFDVTAFGNRYDDLIISVGRSFSGVSRWQTDNISNARARGVEASAAWRPTAALSVQGAYTFLSTAVLAVDGSRDAPPPYTVGDPLLRRPRHQVSVDATWSRGRLGAFAQFMQRGATRDAEPAYGPTGGLYRNPSYHVANLGASWRLGRMVTLQARGQNLFDAGYEEVLGFPAPRRTAYAGVRLATGR